MGRTARCLSSSLTASMATVPVLLATLLLLSSSIGGPRGVAASCADSSLSDTAQNATGCRDLAPDVAVRWTTDDVNATFWVEVTSPEVGWVGFGVSEAGGMKGADMAIAMRDEASGQWTLGDYFSMDFVMPQPDAKQDVSLVSEVQANSAGGGTTVVHFTRPLKSCGEEDLTIAPDVPQYFVWAFGSSWGYHGPVNRGTELIQLSRGASTHEDQAEQILAASGPAASDNLSQTENVNTTADTGPASAEESAVINATLAMDNVTIPSTLTNYLCRNFELPDDRDYHVYEYEPHLTSELVHHMILFACNTPPKNVNTLYHCESMPAECNLFYFGWAPGASRLEMPDIAGLPFGNSSYKYAALQVHYNNPEGQVGVQDSSGFSMKYGSRLRKYDMGVLTIGQMDLVLPPRQARVDVPPGVCPSECLRQLPHPVVMVYSFLHMHTLGKSIVTDHFRNGTRLRPVGERDFYDFNFQTPKYVPGDTAALMPGDTLITTCSYDTTKKTTVTEFGESTQDEMCFDFIMYYPKVDIDLCLPISDEQGVQNYSICAPAYVKLDTEEEYNAALQKGQVVEFDAEYYSQLLEAVPEESC